MRIETKEQFDKWFYETVPSALFHIEPTDMDDATGVKLDELILVGLINTNPEVLKFKNLKDLVNFFIFN